MIDHEVGVSIEQMYRLKRVDLDYFASEDSGLPQTRGRRSTPALWPNLSQGKRPATLLPKAPAKTAACGRPQPGLGGERSGPPLISSEVAHNIMRSRGLL